MLARQGFSESELILHWEDIVGERLAASSRPIKLQWPPRPQGHRPEVPPSSATLVIRVEGAVAIELQHMSDQLLARLNAHLGWRCVGKLALKQGPIDRLPPRRLRPPALSSEALADAGARVTGVSHEPLHDALSRLSARITQKATSGSAV